jgi:glycogen operon protein
MTPEDWESGFGRAIGVFLNGNGIRQRDRRGEPITDLHFVVLFNAGDDPIDFTIPAVDPSPSWDVLIDTAGEQADSVIVEPGGIVSLEAKALVVLGQHIDELPEPDHSVAASLAAVAEGRPDDVPAKAPRPELGGK